MCIISFNPESDPYLSNNCKPYFWASKFYGIITDIHAHKYEAQINNCNMMVSHKSTSVQYSSPKNGIIYFQET